MLLEKKRISLYSEILMLKLEQKKGPSALTDPETFGCTKMYHIKVCQHDVQLCQQFA